jgi:pimeloyl-ACP methyl ester carboxylesterase
VNRARWRGLAQLLTLAVAETAALVERTQRNVIRRATRPLLSVPVVAPVAAVVQETIHSTTRTVYRAVHTVNHGVGQAVELGFAVTDGADASAGAVALSPPEHGALGAADHAEGVLNGLFGDTLHARENELALPMTLRQRGQVVALTPAALGDAYPDGTARLVLFVHGLGCTEAIWRIGAHTYYGDPQVTLGARIHASHGITPLYLRYNTGRAVAENGQLLSALLEQLVATYPHSVDELLLIGHSMGGLVACHAVQAGVGTRAAWVKSLRHVVTIGAPHRGAPSARAAAWLARTLGAVDTAATQVTASVLDARSVGIQDLAGGAGSMRTTASTPQVRYGFVGARYVDFAPRTYAQLLGDLVVPLDSACPGGHSELHQGTAPWTHMLPGVNHFRLANHPDLHAAVQAVL